MKLLALLTVAALLAACTNLDVSRHEAKAPLEVVQQCRYEAKETVKKVRDRSFDVQEDVMKYDLLERDLQVKCLTAKGY